MEGVLHESCDPSNTTIITLQRLAQAAAAVPRNGSAFKGPLVYECHSNSGGIDSVAAFLIGAGPYHFFGTGGWQGVEGHYVPEVMNRKLGNPDADGAYDPATQVWTRTFGAAAAHVAFDVKTNTGTVRWADEGLW